MKISNEYPPLFDRIDAYFKIKENRYQPVFCYGDTIYNPFNVKITDDLVTHESVHSVQQGENPEAWWDRYLADAEFRLSQEVEAYKAQYKYIVANVPDRNYVAKVLFIMSLHLGGKMYGNIVPVSKAATLIKN